MAKNDDLAKLANVLSIGWVDHALAFNGFVSAEQDVPLSFYCYSNRYKLSAIHLVQSNREFSQKGSEMKLTPSKLLIAIGFWLVPLTALADVTANIGLMSDYFYRGVLQNTTATTNGGLDFSSDGFFLGTWAADVEDGLEVDVYGGYGVEFESGFTVGAGFTGYFYTGDFDDTYKEINLTASYGIASLEYSFGDYENFDGPTLDYNFTAITLEHNGIWAKYGVFGSDFDGSYFELGYGTEVAGLDISVHLLINDADLNIESDGGSETIIFSLSKTFELK